MSFKAMVLEELRLDEGWWFSGLLLWSCDLCGCTVASGRLWILVPKEAALSSATVQLHDRRRLYEEPFASTSCSCREALHSNRGPIRGTSSKLVLIDPKCDTYTTTSLDSFLIIAWSKMEPGRLIFNVLNMM